MLFTRVDGFLDELTEVVMVNHFAAMVLAVGVTASAMFSDVIVDLVTDPPSIVCEEGWVTR